MYRMARVAKLCRRNRGHHSVSRGRPQKAATLQPLREQGHSLTIMPQRT
jgi:hypothetical protein